MAFDSLFIGVTGLNAYQQEIDVISNNLANVGTTGFKAQNVTFQDLLYQNQSFASAPTSTSGGTNAIQAGDGVQIGSVDTQFGQGGIQTTGVNTDLAINGNGFFILNNTEGNGQSSYTRDGAFSISESGLLYDPSTGQAVMGYAANPNGTVTSNALIPLQIPIGLKSEAVATGSADAAKFGPQGDQVFDATFGGNLNLADYVTAVSSAGVDVNYTTISTTFYDSLGGAHQVDITFQPVASVVGGETSPSGVTVQGLNLTTPTVVENAQGTMVTAASEWAYTITPTDQSDIGGSGAGEPVLGGYIYFDANGQYINTVGATEGSSQTTVGGVQEVTTAHGVHQAGQPPITTAGDQLAVANWSSTDPGSAANSTVPGSDIGLDFAAMTALSSTQTAAAVSQNGYPPGLLSTINVSQNGAIEGSFTNGQVTSLGQVAVATFQNEQGLTLMGGNQYQASADSGLAENGVAGTGANGSIVAGSLEQSNVVIANEFTNMILAQQAFAANSRSVDVGDQDLTTVIQMEQNG